jgi:hypothetical protein
VLDYLTANTTTEKWVLAVSSSMEADSAIIDGYPVLSMGGFSGSDPAMSSNRLAELVRTGQLRYVSAGGGFGGRFAGGFGGGPGGGSGGVASLVSTACTQLDLSAVSSGSSATVIYDCAGKADAIIAAAKANPTTTSTSGGGDGNAPGGYGNGPGGVDLAALQECLVANGADAITTGAGPPNFGDPKVRAALQACSQYLPAGGPGAPGANGGPATPPATP